MFTTLFGRKRINEDKLANLFVNSLLDLVAQGFPLVAAEIDESPEFLERPGLSEADEEPFAVIALTANMIEMQRAAEPGLDRRMFSLCVAKFAHAFDRSASEMEEIVNETRDLLERLNHPSKTTVLGIGKVLFERYDLFRFQDTYFRNQRSPNPIVLKRVNNLMGYFMWNWTETFEQYKVV